MVYNVIVTNVDSIRRYTLFRVITLILLAFILNTSAFAQDDVVDDPLSAYKNAAPLIEPDPSVYQTQAQAFSNCLVNAVEKHYERRKTYRYQRRAIKTACRAEKKALIDAKFRGYGSGADYLKARVASENYTTQVENRTFKQITASIKQKLLEQQLLEQQQQEQQAQ